MWQTQFFKLPDIGGDSNHTEAVQILNEIIQTALFLADRVTQDHDYTES